MTLTDALRSVAVTIAAWCYVLAALSLYTPVSWHWQHGGQRHAEEIAPPEIIWQRIQP